FNTNFSSENGKLLVEAGLYNNNVRNFIYLQPKPDEPVLTIAGAFPKNVYEQADVVLRGIDLMVSLRPGDKIEWTNKYSLLRARNKDMDDWLIRMQSDRLQSELILHLPDSRKLTSSYASVELIHVWEQTRVPSEAN